MANVFVEGSARTVAWWRALVTAIGTGALVTLATWTQTDDPKTIAIAGLSAVIPILIARFGIEGAVDSRPTQTRVANERVNTGARDGRSDRSNDMTRLYTLCAGVTTGYRAFVGRKTWVFSRLATRGNAL